MKKISIIIPVYNSEKYLARCLNSIISQSFMDLEIIIINDGSSDNSKKIIEKFKQKDSRIIFVNKTKNEGVSAARNLGVELANGEYILMVDSDDWIETNMLSDMYEISKSEEADIVVTDFFEDNKNIIYVQDQILGYNSSKENFIENLCLFKGYSSLWNKLIKRDLFIKNNIQFPINIIIGEDLCFLIKLYFLSKKIVKLNRAYYHYVYNNMSITKSKTVSLNKLKGIKNVLDEISIFFCNKNIDIPLNELKFNHLTNLIFDVKYNFKDNEYTQIYTEYLKSIRKIDLKHISSKKRRFLLRCFRVFDYKIFFIFIWHFNNFYMQLRNNK